MKEQALKVLLRYIDNTKEANDALSELLVLFDVSGSLRYSEREIDFAYLAGVFNVSGIDGLQKEIERLKGLGKNPHDIIIAARGNDRITSNYT